MQPLKLFLYWNEESYSGSVEMRLNLKEKQNDHNESLFDTKLFQK